MASLIETQICLVQYAQEQYQDAINKQSSPGAEFWLQQLHCLCQQLYWLKTTAESPVTIAKSSLAERPLEYWGGLQKPGMIEISEPVVKRQPTEYAWNDGFAGVTLDQD